MKPASLSAQIVARVSLFRGDPATAIAEHARNLERVHALNLDGIEAVADRDLTVLNVSRPGDLSEQVLALLFGQWPPNRSVKKSECRRPLKGVTVTELDWSEWRRVADAVNVSGESS